jgi:cytochrome b561
MNADQQRQPRFSGFARTLHWLMAVMILAMLFIGIGMVATVSDWHDVLLAVHQPLGIAILLLAVIRLLNRWRDRPPPLPAALPRWQRWGARGSHALLYTLMLAMPLIGWAMLSAADAPVVLFGSLQLPHIAPHSVSWFAWLRGAHTWLGLALFGAILLHLAAALFHGLVRRDGVLQAMASWRPGGGPQPGQAQGADPAADGRSRSS